MKLPVFSWKPVHNILQMIPSCHSYNSNKKVLLRERKRHTARRVVSTPSVVLPGYPPPGGGGLGPGTPRGGGLPDPGFVWVPRGGGGVPDPGTPRGGPGTPSGGGGYLTRVPPGGVWVPRGGTWSGYLTWVPPLPHGILGNVAKHYGIWVPPPCGQTD